MSDADTSRHFQMSSTTNQIPLNLGEVGLVGRSEERAFLLDTLHRICTPEAPSQVVVVRGDSGTGKSSLIQSLRGECEAQHVWFASGKYEQFESVRAYGGLLDAFAELCDLVSQQNLEDGIAVRQSIQQQLGQQEIDILTSLMPFAKTTLLKEEEKKELEESRSKDRGVLRTEHCLHRVTVVLMAFLRAFAREKRPVVLFLDDMQYADEASRQFTNTLVSSFEGTNVLILASVREDDGSKFDLAPDSPNGLSVSTVTLSPLGKESVNKIVSTAIERRPQETLELSDVVTRKTGGNPFFCVQYLELLHREAFLGFSFRSSKWEWDMESIMTRTNVSENVGQIMTSKIKAMPDPVQTALMLAASLGSSFSPDMLVSMLSDDSILEALRLDPRWTEAADAFSADVEKDIVTNVAEEKTDKNVDAPEGTVARSLSLAREVGLLETSLRSGRYKFSHDRVQQSSHDLFPTGETGELLNQRLGEFLLRRSRSQPSDGGALLYASLNLLLKTSESNKARNATELSRLCLEAAQQASRQSAFITAAFYADSGLSLLDLVKKWEDHYELSLLLSIISAQMHFAYGNLEKSRIPLKEILDNARNIQDMSEAYSVKVAACGACCDFAGGLRDGAQAVRALGVRIPENPRRFHVAIAAMKAHRAMKNKTMEDLKNLPRMTDPAVIEAMQVLKLLTCYDWRGGRSNHLMLHSLAMLQLTLKYGLGCHSPYAFSLYGVLKGHEGKFDEASDFGALSLELAERKEMRDGYTWAVKVVHLFLYHLRHPIFDSLGPFLKCFEMAKAIGDITVACYSLQAHAMVGIIAGMPLDSLVEEINGYIEFFIEYRQVSPMMEIQPYFQLALNMKGQCDDPLVLTGEAMDEKEFLSTALASKQGAAATVMFIYSRSMLLYLFGALELADKERQKIKPQNDIPSSFFMKYLNIFFSALICLGLAREQKSKRYLKLAQPYVKQLRTYASCGSVNAVPLLKLVEAEELAVRGKPAERAYEVAISMAGRSGFNLVKAIAYECAGVHMLGLGDNTGAKHYLQQAMDDFLDYQAFGKAKQMSDKYEMLDEDENKRKGSFTSSASSRRMQPFLVKSWQGKVEAS